MVCSPPHYYCMDVLGRHTLRLAHDEFGILKELLTHLPYILLAHCRVNSTSQPLSMVPCCCCNVKAAFLHQQLKTQQYRSTVPLLSAAHSTVQLLPCLLKVIQQQCPTFDDTGGGGEWRRDYREQKTLFLYTCLSLTIKW